MSDLFGNHIVGFPTRQLNFLYRLLTVDDPQNTREYPYLQKKCKKQRTLCRVCYTQAARWVFLLHLLIAGCGIDSSFLFKFLSKILCLVAPRLEFTCKSIAIMYS